VILRLALILAASGAALVPLPASWVETLYSQRLYLSLQRALTSLSNQVSFSLFDVLLAVAGAWVAATLVRLPGRWRKEGAVRALGSLLLRWATASSVVYLAFVVVWGLNYRRPPLASKLSFSRERVTDTAARELAARVVARANQLRAGGGVEGPSWGAVTPLLASSFDRVQRELAPVSPAAPGFPKRTALTLWFERTGVDGMTDPFFLETLVNSSILPFERPFVTAHEWAHLAGYADESEANFVGWLVCLQGPTAAEYSGHVALLWQVLGALSREDRATTLKPLSPGVRADLKAIADRVAKATPVLREASWRVYDKYLKANRVEQGVRSYGAALELMLGTRFKAGWIPEMR
jgi:hypothetical protein